MMPPRKILIVFPHNFFALKSGVHKRYYEFARSLKEKGFTIDLLGLRHFESRWENFKSGNTDQLVDRLFLYDFRIGYHLKLLRDFLLRLLPFLNMKPSARGIQLPDYAFPGMTRMFDKIIRNNRYQYVVIGYVYWANLLKKGLPPGTRSILTIEDFVSLKLSGTSAGGGSLDAAIEDEAERVNLFDKAICLSYEELAFFSVHAPKPVYFFVPVFMEKPALVAKEKEFDILFIGFDNPENMASLAWFFGQVFPLLPAGIKIRVVGKVARFSIDLPGVTKTEYVQDLGDVYMKSRVSINPMQGGTGMKVKVVESLAYGIPVVSTPKGLCGMPPGLLKEFIVAGDPQSFAAELTRLLTDQLWYAKKCREAEKIFAAYFDAGVVSKKLDEIFSRNQ